MRCFRSRRPTLAALAVAIAACARPAPDVVERPPIADATLSDPRAVLVRLQDRETQIRSVRSRFTATVTTPHAQRQLSGVLLTEKPHRLRFRLTLPFGVTVFDLVAVGDGAIYLYTPSDDLVERFLADGLDPLSWPDLFLYPDVDAARCGIATTAPSGLIDAQCYDRGRLAVRTSDATVAMQYDGDVVMQYDDYRPVSGILMPYRIVIRYPADVVVTVEVEQYELNPVLDGGVFEPPAAAKLVVIP
jgi:outer membrane lipoprotein-sorting protein